MFNQSWPDDRPAPPPGMAVAPSALTRGTAMLGKDELTVPRLAEVLPTETAIARYAIESIIKPDERTGVHAAIERILRAARPVAKLETRRGGNATGFMITPDKLLTNNHAFVGRVAKRVATPADAAATVTFNYEQDSNGKMAQAAVHRTAPEQFFAANLELDYAVVAVDGAPGEQWGTIPLPRRDITIGVGGDVFIIQHPGGGPKQIVMSGNVVAYVDEKVVQYTTDTMEGSSGAPVFDWQWQLVALHHAGGDLKEPATGRTYYRNEGIRLSAIMAAGDF